MNTSVVVVVFSLFVVHAAAYCPANGTRFTSCTTIPAGGDWTECVGNVTFTEGLWFESTDISCLSGVSLFTYSGSGGQFYLNLRNLTGDTVMDFTNVAVDCNQLFVVNADHPLGTTLTINFGDVLSNSFGVGLAGTVAGFSGACGNIVMTAQSCTGTPRVAGNRVAGTVGDITLQFATGSIDVVISSDPLFTFSSGAASSNLTIGDMTVAYGALTTIGSNELRLNSLGNDGNVIQSVSFDAGTGCVPNLDIYQMGNVGPITIRQPDCDMNALNIGRSNEFMTPSSVSVTARSIATLNHEQTRGTDVTVTTTQNITNTLFQDVEGGVIRVTAPNSMANVELNNVNASVSFEVCTGTVDLMYIESLVGGVVDTRAIKQLLDLDLDQNFPDVLACDNFTITDGNATVSDCDTNNDGVPDLCASGGGGGGSTPSPASHFAAGPWPSLAALTVSALVPLMTLF